MPKVHICGNGIAACCGAHLLVDAGFHVTTELSDQATVPVILLSAATQALIQDVLGRTDLFAGRPVIKKRVVSWGRQREPRILPHNAVAISEAELAQRLRPANTAYSADSADPESKAVYAILASRPLPDTVVEHHFGSRIATVLQVDLPATSDPSACWIESLTSGWLFLIPAADRAGWLLGVGAPHEELLAESRLVAPQLGAVWSKKGQFGAYPRISDPLCGTGWLACGSAALGFDPLCGSGAGNAVRETILATAVCRAIAKGAEEAKVLAHYESRLQAAFLRHLDICRDFYTAGNSGPWWDAELELLERGRAWVQSRAQTQMPYQFRLRGFELQAIT